MLQNLQGKIESEKLTEEDYSSRKVSSLSMSDVDIIEQIQILQNLEEKKETQRMTPEQQFSSRISREQSSFVQQQENLQEIQEELNEGLKNGAM